MEPLHIPESQRLDVVGSGSMVVDEISWVPRLLGADGKMLLHQDAERPAVQRLVGGVTLNHLAWARCLGLSVGIFGKQADDDGGRFLRSGMDRLGLERSIDLSGSSSSFARVYVDDSRQRAIYMARGATAELRPEEIDRLHAPLIARARIVTSEVSQLPLAAVRRSFERALDAGARTVLDLDVSATEAVPALGADRELRAVLQLSSVLKASGASLRGLVSSERPEEQALELSRSLGCQAVVITLGSAGALVRAGAEQCRMPGLRVDVLDPTGAGDAFLGGLLAGMSHGLDWPDALRLANASGATCCEQVGGFPEAPPALLRTRILERFRELGGSGLD